MNDLISTSVRWKIHLSSAPEDVYAMFATPEGRAKFWAESALEIDGCIEFVFPGDFRWRGRILDVVVPIRYSVEYFGGSTTTISIKSDGDTGTDLVLVDENIPSEHVDEVRAGWVSVLLTLKAAVDHGVDLRNHDSARTWELGYVDN